MWKHLFALLAMLGFVIGCGPQATDTAPSDEMSVEDVEDADHDEHADTDADADADADESETEPETE